LFVSPVAAGQPDFADDAIEEQVDLTQWLVRDPEKTFLVRARGESMLGIGINPGDLLVVEHAPEASSGRIVIAIINGEPTVKRVRREGKRVLLVPENPDFPVLEVAEEGARILGVVTHVIHAV
jgi:DNA polymerase V